MTLFHKFMLPPAAQYTLVVIIGHAVQHHTSPVLQDDFPSSFSILMCKSYISCTVLGMEMNHCTKMNHLPPAMAIDDARALLDRVSNFSFHGNLRPPQKWVWPHIHTTCTQGLGQHGSSTEALLQAKSAFESARGPYLRVPN